MTKKLKQGERYPEGFTQSQILLKLCEKDKTPTSEIIDFLKERFGIREQKNIREHHLKKLEKKNLIKRESAGRGHPDYWYAKPDAETSAKFLNMFVGTEYEEEFLKSVYIRRFGVDNLEMRLPVLTTIFDKLKTVQLLCNTFYPDSPMAETLDALFAPNPSDDLTVEELHDLFTLLQCEDVDGVCALFIDFFERREAERIASGGPRRKMPYGVYL